MLHQPGGVLLATFAPQAQLPLQDVIGEPLLSLQRIFLPRIGPEQSAVHQLLPPFTRHLFIECLTSCPTCSSTAPGTYCVVPCAWITLFLVIFVYPYTSRGCPCGEVRRKYSAKSRVAEQLHDLVAGDVDRPSRALSLFLFFLLLPFFFSLCTFFVFVFIIIIVIIIIIFVFIISGLEDQLNPAQVAEMFRGIYMLCQTLNTFRVCVVVYHES